jgi:hypothetical protein
LTSLTAPSGAGRHTSGLLEYLANRQIGLRPLFTLVPPEPREEDESGPPTFALVARAKGRTLVSLTRPGTKIGPEDDLVLQRMVVSDLLQGHRFSLTVHNDHVLGARALRFLGVGARLTARPEIKVRGWRLTFELFGSYHPNYGGTGYLAISGGAPAPPIPTALPGQ